ncbi:MAG: ferrochelatase, partial [SAR324 cluster bacterium]|nr:ferrochelatase [SAR324 cluster bacterium]
MKTGLMLINLGTPDSPSTADVRSYLREFLSDPRVIDLPFLGRWLLLNLIILPFRPR